LELQSHEPVLPAYSTFVRTSSWRFVVGSSFTIHETVTDELTTFDRREEMEASFRRTQRCFRAVRNSYIRYIVPDVLDRETEWANAMRKTGITRFVPEQREAVKNGFLEDICSDPLSR
jgi:hypothetical protein